MVEHLDLERFLFKKNHVKLKTFTKKWINVFQNVDGFLCNFLLKIILQVLSSTFVWVWGH